MNGKENKMSEKLNNNITVKLICFIIAAILAIVAGIQFYDHRTYKETVVVSDSFSEKKMLSDYVPSLKNTMADTPVFFFDSGVEGGTVLYLGGTHPYEPAASLSAFVMMENINVEKGRVIIIPQANLQADRRCRSGRQAALEITQSCIPVGFLLV
jgi:hypothetical protein